MVTTKRVKLSEIATLITKGTTPTTLGFEFQETGINFLKIECFEENGDFIPEKVAHISEECNDKLKRSQLAEGDILFSIAGAIGRVAIVTKEMLPANTNQALSIIRIDRDDVHLPFVKLILTSPIIKKQFERKKQGVAQLNLSLKDIGDLEIPLPSKREQIDFTDKFSKIQSLITHRKQQLAKLDELVKARFVEMFGDFKTNPKGWRIVHFTEIASIDGNMTTEFEKYADYPHIGIDSIEKETGRLVGYRTVSEDNVVSGKYLFTPQHLIYSKIRPNLNKVALPSFHGVCSADAYPILPKEGKCNRVFLAHVMQSKFFLDYILQFCSRTNLPKVNRKEVSGFSTPLPPLELQQQFAAFVEQTDKSKVAVQKALDEAQLLFDSLMQEYFG